MIIIAVLYTFAATALSLYGLYVLALVAQFLRYQRRSVPPPIAPTWRDAELPVVTVQLPMFNERYVAERGIDAIAALDWPRDRLQIQVLDDSTDDTTAIARARVELHRRRGVDVALIHRSNRDGYKAGALANGLNSARGEYLAIFDADFVPAPDFLRQLMPHFGGDASIGFVQARWEHLNYERSALARALAIAVDGHFVVEQFARCRSGWPMIFNGSAGIWRRVCIERSGGWQGDTLCEDMDLSYRAMLSGWRCEFAPEVTVPQEEPESIGAVKSQHARWAKGGAQCLRKHAASIVRSRRWSPAQKATGLAYLAGYTAHLMMLLIVLLWLPLAIEGRTIERLPLTFLGLSGLGLPLEYAISQWALHRRDGLWLRRLAYLPVLLLIGFGAAFSNARAVLAGLLTRGGEFHRTPKVTAQSGATAGYRPRGEALAWFEMGLALYAAAAAAALWTAGHAATSAFVVIYALGFSSVGAGSLVEAVRAERVRVRAFDRPTQLGRAAKR
jgi:cellulose synthase/poly-beta-1,6-N-acetylglucosamine synthase-like glycosyltransferase